MNSFIGRASYPLRFLMVSVVVLFLGGVVAANRTMAAVDRAEVAAPAGYDATSERPDPRAGWTEADVKMAERAFGLSRNACRHVAFSGNFTERVLVVDSSNYRAGLVDAYMVGYNAPYADDAFLGCAAGVEDARAGLVRARY